MHKMPYDRDVTMEMLSVRRLAKLGHNWGKKCKAERTSIIA